MADPLAQMAQTHAAANAQPDKRALLAAMAQRGNDAITDYNTQGGPDPTLVDQRMGAVSGALARAQKLGAPQALQDQVTASAGEPFDAAANSQVKDSNLTGAYNAALSKANGAYMGQLSGAQGLMEQRTKLAVQQILADRSDKEAQRAFDNRQLDYNNRQLTLKEKETAQADPVPVQTAAKSIGLAPGKTKTILQSPAYEEGRNLVLDAAKKGYSYDEILGQLQGYATQPDADGLYLGGSSTPQPEIAQLLTAVYGPTFTGYQAQTVQPTGTASVIQTAMQKLNDLPKQVAKAKMAKQKAADTKSAPVRAAMQTGRMPLPQTFR